MLPALLLLQPLRADDVESLHIVNANLDFKPGWTLQLHTRVRTFENMGSFNQFRGGPILMVQVRPRVVGLAGYYYINQNRRVVHQDFSLHRVWAGGQVRVLRHPNWTADARSLAERFVSGQFPDYFRFRNRIMVTRNGGGRRLLPFVSAEALRQQNIWYARYTAGVQYRLSPKVLTSIGYEYRASPTGPPSHILATMVQFERIRRVPPHID